MWLQACWLPCLTAWPPPPPVRENQVTLTSLAQIIGTLTAARHRHGGLGEGYADSTDPQSPGRLPGPASLPTPLPPAPSSTQRAFAVLDSPQVVTDRTTRGLALLHSKEENPGSVWCSARDQSFLWHLLPLQPQARTPPAPSPCLPLPLSSWPAWC